MKTTRIDRSRGYSLLNTQYSADDAGRNDEYDAHSTGNNRFGYLTLAESHSYRDEKDSEAELQELDFDSEGDW